MTPTNRRFPPPWSVEEQEECFTVRDHRSPKTSSIAPRAGRRTKVPVAGKEIEVCSRERVLASLISEMSCQSGDQLTEG